MLTDYVKTADWVHEKHVPVIDAPETVAPGEPFPVTVTVGKEIPHPNTPGHFIAWVALHFVPDGAATSIELGRCEFSAHGAVAAAGTAPAALTDAAATFRVSLAASGTLHATAYCNIHGLWSSARAVACRAAS